MQNRPRALQSLRSDTVVPLLLQATRIQQTSHKKAGFNLGHNCKHNTSEPSSTSKGSSGDIPVQRRPQCTRWHCRYGAEESSAQFELQEQGIQWSSKTNWWGSHSIFARLQFKYWLSTMGKNVYLLGIFILVSVRIQSSLFSMKCIFLMGRTRSLISMWNGIKIKLKCGHLRKTITALY